MSTRAPRPAAGAFKRDPTDKKIAVYVSQALYAELEAEAWEEERYLSDYVRRLLAMRKKREGAE